MVGFNNIIESSMAAKAKEAAAMESGSDKKREVQVLVKSGGSTTDNEAEVSNTTIRKYCPQIRDVKIIAVLEMIFEAGFIFILLLKFQGIQLIGDVRISENAGKSTCGIINNWFGFQLATERSYYLEWSNLIYPAMAFTWGLSLFVAVHKKELHNLTTKQIYVLLGAFIVHLTLPMLALQSLCTASNYYSFVDTVFNAFLMRWYFGLFAIIILCRLIAAIKHKDSAVEIRTNKPWLNYFRFTNETSTTANNPVRRPIPGDIAGIKTMIICLVVPTIAELVYLIGRRIYVYTSQQQSVRTEFTGRPTYYWLPVCIGQSYGGQCVAYLEDNTWDINAIVFLTTYTLFLVFKLLLGITSMWKVYGNVKTYDQIKVIDCKKYIWSTILTMFTSIIFVYHGFNIKIYEMGFIYPIQMGLIIFVYIPMICFLALVVLNKKKSANNSNGCFYTVQLTGDNKA